MWIGVRRSVAHDLSPSINRDSLSNRRGFSTNFRGGSAEALSFGTAAWKIVYAVYIPVLEDELQN